MVGNNGTMVGKSRAMIKDNVTIGRKQWGNDKGQRDNCRKQWDNGNGRNNSSTLIINNVYENTHQW